MEFDYVELSPLTPLYMLPQRCLSERCLETAWVWCFPANRKVDKWLTNRFFGGDPLEGEE
jgi:hypothetical protein